MSNMEKNLSLVISLIKEDGKVKVDMRFQNNGKEITYADVTTDEKSVFVKACDYCTGLLASITLTEMGIDPKTGKPFKEKKS